MDKQAVINQKGEVEFRRKIYKQQIEGHQLFDDEFDAAGIEQIMKERMDKTVNQMLKLKDQGVRLDPYLEIGAERGQRALALENHLDCEGIAADISFDMLKSAEHYRQVYNLSKMPRRICCDANRLPFKSQSFPFVFCYQTLHHFPDPTCIIEEIHRVLKPGGYFFFDEEPYNQVLRWYLYKGQGIYSKESLNRSKLRKAVDYFFKEPSCNEVDHHIIENHQVSITGWKKALSIFEKKELQLTTVKSISTNANASNPLKYLIAYLLGGDIRGICQKAGEPSHKNASLESLYLCPQCQTSNTENETITDEGKIICVSCGEMYREVDGVTFLLNKEKKSDLYPEFDL